MIQVFHKKIKNVWFGASVHENQVLSTYFSTKEPNITRLLQGSNNKIPFEILDEPNQFLREVLKELEKVFTGKKTKRINFNLDLRKVSNYSKKVLKCTHQIPVGYITTYKALAKTVGGSPRSVGRVEAKNPIPLLIPCHRVVCSDFKAGGYGNGEQMKIKILQREERGYEKIQELKVKDKSLALFPVNLVYKRQGIVF
ncbi:methylated-DNA--[protein]-cysteine S-methyltransferase [Candidatus Bathyarchaeota archaeon]|nr:methylated-DNA--[protein]-cysteine S-methyltransferase [Candidatus Bathyarchaeota archaeon]